MNCPLLIRNMWNTIIWMITFLVAVSMATVEFPGESQGYTSFPAIPVDTTDILLKSNSISSVLVSDLDGLDLVVKLDMDTNLLTSFPDLSSISSTLEELILKNNMISSVNGDLVSPLIRLNRLNLQDNDLTSFPDVTGPPLEWFSLRFNPIQLWPTFGGIKSTLQSLLIDVNNEAELSADKFEGFDNLLYLNIRSSSLTTIPNIINIRATLQHLQIDNFSLKSAPVERMAILDKLSSLTLSTGLSQIPPVCSGSNSWVNIIVNPFDPCDCHMMWMKAVIEAGGYVAVNPASVCGTLIWSSLTTEQLVTDVCQAGLPESLVRSGMAIKKLSNFFCGFPISAYIPSITRLDCTTACIQTPGCQSFNFRPTGGSVGNCAVVAPSAGGSVNVPNSEDDGWEFFSVE